MKEGTGHQNTRCRLCVHICYDPAESLLSSDIVRKCKNPTVWSLAFVFERASESVEKFGLRYQRAEHWSDTTMESQ